MRPHFATVAAIALCCIALPGTAYADGEDILLLPMGQFLVIPAIVFLARYFAMSKTEISVACVTALAIAVLTWTLNDPFFRLGFPPNRLVHSYFNFAFGLLPPVLIALATTLILRAVIRRIGRAA
jgi:hypothetical protein